MLNYKEHILFIDGVPLSCFSDQSGLEGNLADDSDSLSNQRTSKNSMNPMGKEKRKPFFKKVFPLVLDLCQTLKYYELL